MNKFNYSYSNWLVNWKTNYNSKSIAGKIIDFYEEILKNEFSDSDYWLGDGADEQNLRLLNFTDSDWKELGQDISNWNKNKLKFYLQY